MTWLKASGLPLTQEKLRELVEYDPGTGDFTRLVSVSPRALAGRKCGDIDGKGYVRLRVDGARYLAHRLVWFYIYGAWPENEIDHINGDRTDNRLVNLREATRAQNAWNARGWRKSASGLKGVSKSCGEGRWRARALLNGKEKQIGTYSTREEAEKAYLATAIEAHGEFARVA